LIQALSKLSKPKSKQAKGIKEERAKIAEWALSQKLKGNC
jgi:hypothetical protein